MSSATIIGSTSSSKIRTVPARALLLSVCSLLLPVGAILLAPDWIESEGALLVWLPPILPAFLLAYYKGWHGASVALAGGMATLALVEVELSVLDLPAPGETVVFGVVAGLLTVTLGAGAMGELLLRAREDAEEAAFTDQLTGLPNRRHASLILNAHWGATLRGRGLAAVIFDLDHFKHVNDVHGHAEGDRVLQAFAGILSKRTRSTDLSARFGGEEFISLLPDCTLDRAVAFADDVRELFTELHFGWGNVTLSAGVAVVEEGMGSPDVLVAAADRELYVAKERGRNQVCAGNQSVAQLAPAEELPQVQPKALSDVTVLLVDDDAATLRATNRILTRAGCSVLSAESPKQAVNIITGGTSLDLIVTDIVMPEMSGFTLVDLATRVTPDLPVLYISGYAQEEVYWGGTPGARSAFLTKPMEVDELIKAVEGLLQPGPNEGLNVPQPAIEVESASEHESERWDAGDALDARILVLDDDPLVVRALVRLFKKAGYAAPIGLTDPRKVFQVLREQAVDLMILDIDMPHMDGFQVLERLREVLKPREYFPILVLTGSSDVDRRRAALAAGAMDFLAKPFDVVEARARVRNLLATRRLTRQLTGRGEELEHLVRDRTTDLADTRTELLHRLARAAEYRDDITGRHALRVGLMASRIAAEMGMKPKDIDLIRRTGPLHDIGKIGVPDAILMKPGDLSDEEFNTIKRHTLIGEQILGGSRHEVLTVASNIAVAHHERWDGAGYPHALSGEDIPIEARLVSVADVFDVLSHARPYKEASSPREAVREIKRCAGGQFDPAVVEAFGTICERAGADNLLSLADPIDPSTDTGLQ